MTKAQAKRVDRLKNQIAAAERTSALLRAPQWPPAVAKLEALDDVGLPTAVSDLSLMSELGLNRGEVPGPCPGRLGPGATPTLGKFDAPPRMAGQPAKAALTAGLRKLLLQVNHKLKPV
ncbi:MAG: hypothetical protein RL514_361 [Verrucomicrobiota bacterium]